MKLPNASLLKALFLWKIHNGYFYNILMELLENLWGLDKPSEK